MTQGSTLLHGDKEQIDRWFDRITKELTLEQKADLKKKFRREEEQPVGDGRIRFRQAPALTQRDRDAVTEQVRWRVLRWFARSGLLDPGDARAMLEWDNSGFSVDASVRIAAHDRAGFERLLRYCGRPPFALERLQRADDQHITYRLPNASPDGRTSLSLTPLELIDHLAALIPPPRRHQHRYHGVLAPNSPLRDAVTAYRHEAADATDADADRHTATRATAGKNEGRSPARYLWAMLLARLFETFPLVCPDCGGEMRLVAFVTEASPVRRILSHVGEPTEPPPITPARGPPDWGDELGPLPDYDAVVPPVPEFQYDQRVS